MISVVPYKAEPCRLKSYREIRFLPCLSTVYYSLSCFSTQTILLFFFRVIFLRILVTTIIVTTIMIGKSAANDFLLSIFFFFLIISIRVIVTIFHVITSSEEGKDEDPMDTMDPMDTKDTMDTVSETITEDSINIEEGSSETTCEDSNNNKNDFNLNKNRLTIHRPKHTFPNNDTELGYYLAGVIDGDGYISNDSNQMTITVSFHRKDISLAHKLKDTIKYGSVKSYSRNNTSLIYTITNREGIIRICNLIYKKLRIQRKVDRLNLLILKLNLPLLPTVIDTSLLLTSHYLAGLIDTDGCFSIRLLNRLRNNKERTETRLYIRIELQESELHILESIKSTFGGSISKRVHKTNHISYSYNSVSYQACFKWIQYLDKYNLNSNKYLEYLFLRKAYLLVQSGEHLTTEGVSKLEKIQSTMSRLKNINHTDLR